MKEQIKKAATEISALQKKIATILKDLPAVKEATHINLENVKKSLDVRAGVTSATEIKTFSKITKLKGKEWGEDKQKEIESKEPPKVQMKTADEVFAEEIKKEVDLLEPNFTKIDSAKLVDEYSDIVLRGIAKRAGLPVTDDEPKIIGVAYIDKIKEQIKNNQEIKIKQNPEIKQK